MDVEELSSRTSCGSCWVEGSKDPLQPAVDVKISKAKSLFLKERPSSTDESPALLENKPEAGAKPERSKGNNQLKEHSPTWSKMVRSTLGDVERVIGEAPRRPKLMGEGEGRYLILARMGSEEPRHAVR